MRAWNRYAKIGIVAAAVMAGAGCASLKEGAKGFLGVSTKVLDDARPQALTQTFPQPLDQVQKDVRDHLQKMGCYIYARKDCQGLTAVYLNSDDTTPVGIYLTPAEQNSTKVEISSPSTYAKERLSKRLFARLAGKADPEDELLKKQQAKEDAKQ